MEIDKLIIIVSCVITAPAFAGKAEKKKLYDERCKRSEECKEGLTCTQMQCKCLQDQVFSYSKKICQITADSDCKESPNFCVDNATCVAYSSGSFCICDDNFYQSEEGRCEKIATFGKPCVQSEPNSCGFEPSVRCIRGRCSCALGRDQFFDLNYGSCISFAESACIPEDRPACVENATCTPLIETLHDGSRFLQGHECQCDEGFDVSEDRRCLAGFGINCGLKTSCNHEKHLSCVNEKCGCRNALNEVYDKEDKSCKVLVGSRCPQKEKWPCVKNAFCETLKPKTPSVCICSKGYSRTPDNRCKLDLGQACSSGECNEYSSLICINGSCNCLDSYLSYDQSSKMCKSLKGFPCGPVKIDGKEVFVQCEKDAVCKPFFSGYPKQSRMICSAEK